MLQKCRILNPRSTRQLNPCIPPLPGSLRKWLHEPLYFCCSIFDVTRWIAAAAEKISMEPDISPGRTEQLSIQVLPRTAFWEGKMWVTLGAKKNPSPPGLFFIISVSEENKLQMLICWFTSVITQLWENSTKTIISQWGKFKRKSVLILFYLD